MTKKITKPVFRLANDSVFKELFSKHQKALLILIKDVLNLDYDIDKINYKIETSNELHKTKEKNKTTICDFVVKVGDYFTVNVELNREKYTGLTERNLMFVSRILSNTISKKAEYKDLPKYKIAQLNINCFTNINGKILAKVMLVDVDTGTIQTEAMFIYNFDVAKCSDIYYNKVTKEEDVSDRLIRWGTLLNTSDTSKLLDIMGDDLMDTNERDEFIKTAKELEEKHRVLSDDDYLQLTEYYMAGERLLGIEEGKTQGIEQNKIEIVTNMLNKNLDIKLISEVTNLTEEEIMKIKESL